MIFFLPLFFCNAPTTYQFDGVKLLVCTQDVRHSFTVHQAHFAAILVNYLQHSPANMVRWNSWSKTTWWETTLTRPPGWEMILIKDHLMRDGLDERPPDERWSWWKTTCWEMILMKDHPDNSTLMKGHHERPSCWKATLMGDHPDETTPMKGHPDETTLTRPPQWDHPNMSPWGDHPDERPPWWDHPERSLWWDHPDETTLKSHPDETTLMRDYPNERPPWWKSNPMRGTLMWLRELRPPWQETTLMRDHAVPVSRCLSPLSPPRTGSHRCRTHSPANTALAGLSKKQIWAHEL